MAQNLNLNQLKNLDMHDGNWTAHDKLEMYRGLLKLYNREQANQVHDSTLLKKQNLKKLVNLKEEVKELRNTLGIKNAQVSDVITTALQENRQLQLALQNSTPQEAKAEMDNKIFINKNVLDKLEFETVLAEKSLAEYQMELDSLLNDESEQDYDKRDARQMLHNRIEEFRTKTVAGRNIQSLYDRMISCLRKDQGYFEAVLESLKDNARLQQSCIIRGIEIGQLATEEVANMREEYQRLEHDVRQNMDLQQATLEQLQAQLTALREETKTLVRDESFTTLKLDFSNQSVEVETELEKEVNELNTLLKRMQNAILVPGFQDIFPRMLEQLKQNERLLEDLSINDSRLGLLLRKINHGELILTATINTAAGDAAMFQAKKDSILKEVQEADDELNTLCKEQDEIGKLIIELKKGLQRLWNIGQPIEFLSTNINYTQEEALFDECEVVKTALTHLMILQKLPQYMQGYINKKLRQEDRERILASHIKKRTKLEIIEAKEEKANRNVSFNLHQDVDDPRVPSRAEIKAESKKICDAATANPYAVPLRSKKSSKPAIKK